MVAIPWAIIHLEEAGSMAQVRILGIEIATQIFHGFINLLAVSMMSRPMGA
jgi:hypothetical protein